METYYQERNNICLLSKEEKNILSESLAETFDQTYSWFEALQEIFIEEGKKIKIGVLKNSEPGSCSLVAPLYTEIIGATPIRFDYIRSLSNYYTAFYEPGSASCNDIESVVHEFLKTLVLNNKKAIRFDFNPMDPDSRMFTSMVKGFEAAGFYVETYFRFGNWYLSVNGRNFDTYYNSVPSRIRSTIKRKERKLEKSVKVKKIIYTKKDDVNKAIADYERVYEKSWKQTEPHMSFIKRIVLKYSEKGFLRLGLVYVDGEPAAGQIWFVYNGTASIFKLAYDPKFSNYSVGSILTKELMRHVIDVDRVNIVDYLCGDDDYKKDWMSERRERWGIRAYKKTNIFNWPSILKLKIKKYYHHARNNHRGL